MGATNIGRNLARLLDGRPLMSAPQGLDAQLLDLDVRHFTTIRHTIPSLCSVAPHRTDSSSPLPSSPPPSPHPA
eukprot:scaffold6650_cov110-Isochrysis_galbana.AAC.2